MGISMLNGIFSSILGAIIDAVMWLIGKVFGFIFRYIVAPLLSIAWNLISYALGLGFYSIAIFLLALIDYVEILFRLLAGLDVEGMRLTLEGSKLSGEGTSDLLLQLITTDAIQQAFLSMAIVGVFLLLITTVFKMIQVEYTTEGSKNAKGPILEKAFKGLANLMLLPVLVIFGVFLGNQVLDLIDTATKGGDGSGRPTIAGTLFVAAAADARYKSLDLPVTIHSWATAPNELVLLIIPMSFNAITDMLESEFGVDKGDIDESGGAIEVWNYATGKGTVDLETGEWKIISDEQLSNNFVTQKIGFKYWNIFDVTSYYDISDINYLMLLVGGIFVIKTLYFTCFGMIQRLYYCGALFIVSPMVIGMSPVNEGGLANWRKSFIGKALSAYGVVISMNVFFIVVSVLLSVEFKFDGVHDYFFGANMMEGILKYIFVLGGCLMMEKMCKDFGAYFGAEDALSAGKELEKGVKEETKKGVKTAVMVAATVASCGAGGAALSAAGGGGLGGFLKAGAGKVMDKGKGAVGKLMNSAGLDDPFFKKEEAKRGAKVDSLRNDFENETGYFKKKEQLSANEEKMKSNQSEIDRIEAIVASKETLSDADSKKYDKLKEEQAGLKQSSSSLKNDIATAESSDKYKKYKKEKDDLYDFTEKGEARKAAATNTRDQIAKNALSSFGGWGDAFGEGKKLATDAAKQVQESGGENAKMIYGIVDKEKKDKQEETFNVKNKAIINKLEVQQMGKLGELIGGKIQVQDKENDIAAQKSQEVMNDLQNQLMDARSRGDDKAIDRLKTELLRREGSLKDQGFEIRMDSTNHYEIKAPSSESYKKILDELMASKKNSKELLDGLEEMKKNGKLASLDKASQDALVKAIKDAISEMSGS